MIFRKLSEVAPPSASSVKPAPNDTVWHLTLDQIESGSGKIFSRIYGRASEAGSSTFAFDNGNVLYSKLRPYLNKVICPNAKGIATTELVPLRPIPSQLHREYLFFYLRSPEFVSWASSQVDGAKMPRMKMKSFWAYEIPLPPLDDQKRIAHLLGKVEGLIARRKHHLQQLDDLLKSVFLEMFGDPVRNEKGWNKDRIGQSTKVQGGFAFKSKDLLTKGNVRLVKIANVHFEKLIWNDVSFVPDNFHEVYSRFALCEGDLLIALTRPIIKSLDVVKTATISENDLPCLLNQRVARFIFDEATINKKFFLQYCYTNFFKNTVDKLCPPGLQPNISTNQIEDIPIYYPPIALQNQFAAIVEKVQSLKSRYQQSLTDLETLYGALSQKAFKGELDLSRVVLPVETSTNATGFTTVVPPQKSQQHQHTKAEATP